MSKKTFSGGLNSLLGENKELKHKPELLKPERGENKEPLRQGPGRPKTQTKVITKSSQEGTKENETRATFIVKEDLLEKLKAIAYWDRSLIKDVVNQALEETVKKYEKKNGPVKPAPKK